MNIIKPKPSTNLREFNRGTGAGKGPEPRHVEGDTFRSNYAAAFTRPPSPCCQAPTRFDRARMDVVCSHCMGVVS